MSYINKDFISWIRKYGSSKDKEALQGSGLPTGYSRKLEDDAYKNYLKYLRSEKI